MTITQTVEIPADRRLTIDIPREVPTGRAQVEFKIIPFVKKDAQASGDIYAGIPSKLDDDILQSQLDILEKVDW